MKKSKDIENLLELFYQAHHIPVFLFHGDDMPSFYATWFETAINRVAEVTADFLIFTDSQFFTWGIIRKHKSNNYVLTGPVFSAELNDEEVCRFIKDHGFSGDGKNEAEALVRSIPVTSYPDFFSLFDKSRFE